MATNPSNRRNTGIPMPKVKTEDPYASVPKKKPNVDEERAKKLREDAAAKRRYETDARIAARRAAVSDKPKETDRLENSKERLKDSKESARVPKEVDGPGLRSEGGIVTPNGVAQVDPFYRNQG